MDLALVVRLLGLLGQWIALLFGLPERIESVLIRCILLDVLSNDQDLLLFLALLSFHLEQRRPRALSRQPMGCSHHLLTSPRLRPLRLFGLLPRLGRVLSSPCILLYKLQNILAIHQLARGRCQRLTGLLSRWLLHLFLLLQ